MRGPLESAKICADGQEDISAPYLEDIKISKMKDKLRLVHPLDNDFFEACREKLFSACFKKIIIQRMN